MRERRGVIERGMGGETSDSDREGSGRERHQIVREGELVIERGR